MKNLLDSEKQILELVRKHPEILTNVDERRSIAEKVGLSEKTIRNRISELKKHGFIQDDNVVPVQDSDNIKSLPSYIFMSTLWLNKYRIIRNAFITAVVMVGISFMLPKTYKAKAVILITKEENSILGAGNLAPMFGNMGFLGNLNENESMTFLAILKSRTVMEDAVKKFDLMERYETKSIEKAVDALRENASFEINEENALEIVVLSKTGWFHDDPEEIEAGKLAADIANYYSIRLDEVNKNLKTEKARAHRKFIEDRYLKSIEELKKAETDMELFQKSSNIVNLPEQTIAMLEVASMLQGEIYMKEMEKSVLSETYSQSHPTYTSKLKEINVLKTQLDTLYSGFGTDHIFPSISKLPDLGKQYVHYYRELEIKNKIYNLLTQEYENAKIQESKDTPTLQILDKASVPTQKYKPQRGKLVILAFLLATIFSIYFYYFKSRYKTNVT